MAFGVGSKLHGLNTVSVTKALAAAVDYDAFDVLSEHATTGTTWAFDNLVPAAGMSGYIVKAQVICETTVVNTPLVLYLFNAAPTCNLNDNVANTALLHADLAQYVGNLLFPALANDGGATGDAESIITPALATGKLPLAFETASGDDALYGVLVNVDAEAGESAGDDMTIRLTVELA